MLWNLSLNENIAIAIAKQGGIPPLISLLYYSRANAKTEAASTLSNLAVIIDSKAEIAREGGIPLFNCFIA